MKITKVSAPAHVTALSQQFRFSDDALRALDAISVRIKELIQRQKTIEKQLASVTASLFLEVKLGDGPTNSPKISGKPDHVDIPDVEELRRNYDVIREMWEIRESLAAMPSKLRVSLGNRAEAAETKVAGLKKQVDRALEDALKFLQGLALSNRPSRLEDFADHLRNILEKSVTYTDSTTYDYVFEEQSSICFSHYIQLKQLTDLDGDYYPEMFVILTYRTGVNPGLFLTVSPKYAPPSRRLLNNEVKDTKSMIRRLNMLFALDGFANSIGSIPTNILLGEQGLTKDLFASQHYIKSLRVDEDVLEFTLKPTVQDKSEVDRISTDIFQEFQSIISKRRIPGKPETRVRMSIRKAKICFVISLTFANPSGTPFAVSSDLEFLKDRFRLTDAALESIVDTINGARG